jgi:hypothetical protein
MAISRRTFSRLSSFEPQAPNLQTPIANADAFSIGILSDQRESKGLSYRSPLRHQRPQLLIANPELEFHLTGCKNNHTQFSNRKFPGFLLQFASIALELTCHSPLTCPERISRPRKVTRHFPSNRHTAIKIPRNPNQYTTVQDSNRYKNSTFQNLFSPHDDRRAAIFFQLLPASSLQLPASRTASSL